jgi:hypothetical protein
MFLGEKPEFNHFIIFGCPVFVHVPKEKMTKLDPSKSTFGATQTGSFGCKKTCVEVP